MYYCRVVLLLMLVCLMGYKPAFSQVSSNPGNILTEVNQAIEADMLRTSGITDAGAALENIMIYSRALRSISGGSLLCDIQYYLAVNCYELASCNPAVYSNYYDSAIYAFHQLRDRCFSSIDSQSLIIDSLVRVVGKQRDDYHRWAAVLRERDINETVVMRPAKDRFSIAYHYEVSGGNNPEGLNGIQMAMFREAGAGFYCTLRAQKSIFGIKNFSGDYHELQYPLNTSGEFRSADMALSAGATVNIYKPLYLMVGVGFRVHTLVWRHSVNFNSKIVDCWFTDYKSRALSLTPEMGLSLVTSVITAGAGVRYNTGSGQSGTDGSRGFWTYNLSVGASLHEEPGPYYLMYSNWLVKPGVIYTGPADRIHGITIGSIDAFYLTVAANRCFFSVEERNRSAAGKGFLITTAGFNMPVSCLRVTAGMGLIKTIWDDHSQLIKSYPEAGLTYVFHRLMFHLNAGAPGFRLKHDNLMLSAGAGINF